MILFSPAPLSIYFSVTNLESDRKDSLQMGTAEWHPGHLPWTSIAPTLPRSFPPLPIPRDSNVPRPGSSPSTQPSRLKMALGQE